MADRCEHCDSARAEVAALRAELAEVRAQLREVLALCELQKADLDRLQKAAAAVPSPHTPERVPANQLQLAFERVLERLGDEVADNDDEEEEEIPSTPPARTPPRSKPSRGRRRLDLSSLPVQEVVIDPDAVLATQGEGFRLMGQEVCDRLAFRPGMYLRLRIVRRKWAAEEPSDAETVALARAATDDTPATPEPAAVEIAPVPASVWPRSMADASVVAHHIVSKYEDCLPLHRQEQISSRHGFAIARTTQCGWLSQAYAYLYRIVDAMWADAKAHAFCIATDATSAPVRVKGEPTLGKHHVFVFIADERHVVFRHSPTHDGATVRGWLKDYRGYLLADAASIYEALYRPEAVIEVGCWAHLRRYFWKALGSDPPRASEALALIAKLFEVQRESLSVPMPERTTWRAARARTALRLLDAWVNRERDRIDARTPLRAAVTYYDNQREALWRFLDDGRLRLDNNLSEGQLRRLVLGRANWGFFMNTTGVRWFTTFRSLIASCRLHGLNPQTYLEAVLRLAPHWPVTRMLELSPMRWTQTLATLTETQRAALVPPWEAERRVEGVARAVKVSAA